MGHTNSLLGWRNSLFVGVLTFLCCCSRDGGKNGIALVRVMDTSVVITLGGVGEPPFRECAPLAIIMSHMMVIVAPATQVIARPGTRAQRRS